MILNRELDQYVVSRKGEVARFTEWMSKTVYIYRRVVRTRDYIGVTKFYECMTPQNNSRCDWDGGDYCATSNNGVVELNIAGHTVHEMLSVIT